MAEYPLGRQRVRSRGRLREAPMDQDQLVKQLGYGISDDGRTVELRCYRADGTIAHLWFDCDSLANVALGIEGVAGMALRQQRSALKALTRARSTRSRQRLSSTFKVARRPTVALSCLSS
jgi:hypothetical protein